MKIFRKAAELQPFLQEKRSKNCRIGFVPTMGALHDGHLSLIAASKEKCDFTICSIFVNPTQFNDAEDFNKYPVTTDADVKMLEGAGCDILFLPGVDEIYPEGTSEEPVFSFGDLETILEGAHRPGHFKGVGQVVNRLLNIVAPDALFLGQKDYQQCAILRKLLTLTNRTNTELHICPTIREEDGLAMSSRNRRLNNSQRLLAAVLYQCLVSIQSKMGTDNFQKVQKECMELMERKGIEPEYLALAKADDLTLLDDYQTETKLVALIAARVGQVRLIDNMLLN